MPLRPASRRLLVRYAADQAADEEVELVDEEAGLCVIPVVSVNNAPDLKYTELRIEVADYPGLLRVISWVLNGMGMRVHNAVLKTTEDGIAEDTFWLTDYSGRKLSDRSAETLAERLQDYVYTCTPRTVSKTALEYTCGDIFISNAKHPKFTQVTIKGEPDRPGFLLEIASVISGIGLEIAEAEIKGEGGEELYDYKRGRLFRFWVTDNTQNKLDFSRISALVYTLNLIMGHGSAPTTPPNLDILTVNE